MLTTLFNELRIKEHDIITTTLYKFMTYDNKLAMYKKANYMQSKKYAVNKRNVDNFIKCFIYIMYAAKEHYDSKKKAMKYINKNRIGKLRRGNLIKDYDSRYILVPRYRDESYFKSNKNHLKYKFILNEIGVSGVSSLKMFVMAQDILEWYSIVQLDIGGLTCTSEGEKKNRLTRITSIDILKWKSDFLDLVPIESLVDLFVIFNMMDKTDAFALNCFENNDPHKNQNYLTIYDKSKKSKRIYTDEITDLAKREKLTTYCTQVNQYDQLFALTNNSFFTYKQQFFSREDIGIQAGRLYNRFSFLPKPYRNLFCRYAGLCEVDAASSVLNYYSVILTGKAYEYHPTKKFIKFLMEKCNFCDQSEEFQEILYKALKPVVLRAFNSTSRECYKHHVNDVLCSLGMAIDTKRLPSSPSTKKDRLLYSAFYNNSRQTSFTNYVTSMKEYENDRERYSTVISSYDGSYGISTKRFIELLEYFFMDLHTIMYEKNFMINQICDSFLNTHLFKYAQEKNIPLITIHDAIYVPNELSSDANERLKIASMESAIAYRNSLKPDHNYQRLVDSSWKIFSISKLQNIVNNTNVTNLFNNLITIYTQKINFIRDSVNKYSISVDQFYGNDIHFNKLISMCYDRNKCFHYKKKIKNYVNQMDSISVMFNYLIIESNILIPIIDYQLFREYVLSRLNKYSNQNNFKSNCGGKTIPNIGGNFISTTKSITVVPNEYPLRVQGKSCQ